VGNARPKFDDNPVATSAYRFIAKADKMLF